MRFHLSQWQEGLGRSVKTFGISDTMAVIQFCNYCPLLSLVLPAGHMQTFSLDNTHNCTCLFYYSKVEWVGKEGRMDFTRSKLHVLNLLLRAHVKHPSMGHSRNAISSKKGFVMLGNVWLNQLFGWCNSQVNVLLCFRFPSWEWRSLPENSERAKYTLKYRTRIPTFPIFRKTGKTHDPSPVLSPLGFPRSSS